MKRLYWHKKNYRGISREKVFNGVFSIIIVLETNLISQTLEISNMFLAILGVLTVGLLTTSVNVQAYRLQVGVKNGERIVVSDIASNALRMVSVYGYVPIIPLFFVMFTDKNSLRLFWLLISILLLLVVKVFFDNIVTFTDKGYTSGFDEIELNSNSKVELIKTQTEANIGKMSCIEIYKEDSFLGWDKFVQADVEYIINRLKNRINIE